MIILRLAGGLGNQIAQLGAALLLSERVKSKTIIIDDSGLASYKAKHVNQLVNYFDFTRININNESWENGNLFAPVLFLKNYNISDFNLEINIKI